jgi:two-component system sensor histidine kinase ChiS
MTILLGRQRKLWLSICTFFISLILVLSWGSVSDRGLAITTNNPPAMDLATEQWEYRWGDSPLDDAGIPLWTYQTGDTNSADWQAFTLGKKGKKLKKPPKTDRLWLRVSLPENIWNYPSIYLRGLPYQANIYLNQQLVAQDFTPISVLPELKLPNYQYQLPIVLFRSDLNNKTLYFRLNVANSQSIAIALYDPILIGDPSKLLKTLFKKDIDNIVLGFCFIAVGIFAIFVLLKNKYRQEYLAFGFASIAISLQISGTTDIIYLLIEYPMALYYIRTASLYLIPVFFYGFYEHIFGSGYKNVITRLWQIHAGFSVIALNLEIFQIIDGITIKKIFYILALAGLSILIIHIIQSSVKGTQESRLFNIGFTILVGSTIHDIFRDAEGLYVINHTLYHWGMFLFIGFLGLILEHRFSEARKQLKTYSQKLEAQNIELQRLDRLKDEFLANTSHELRTPLNGIIGLAESMIDGATGALTKIQATNLSMIATSGRRLSQLVNDLLDFSQLKHRQIELKLKPVGIRGITDLVVQICHPLIGGKNLQIVNKISEEIPPLLADENRLQQILYNLVGNAIKFTDQGLIEVSAKIISDEDELGHENRQLAITIADTGIGIPEDRLERIFADFEQGDGSTARKYGGTGLGLSVTKQLVELHGGSISVKSRWEWDRSLRLHCQ